MSIEVPCDLKAPLISVSLASLCAHPCLDYIGSMFIKSKNSKLIATHFVRRTIFFGKPFGREKTRPAGG